MLRAATFYVLFQAAILDRCDPCVTVGIVDQSERLQKGTWKFPEDGHAKAACNTPYPKVPREWEKNACKEEFAYYVVRHWAEAKKEFEKQRIFTTTVKGAHKQHSLSAHNYNTPESDIIVGDKEVTAVDEIVNIPGTTLKNASIRNGDRVQEAVALLVHDASLKDPDQSAASVAVEDRRPVYGPRSCTAFLIAPKHVLTSRHCLFVDRNLCAAPGSTLPGRVLVFDYLSADDIARNKSNTSNTTIRNLKIAGCGSGTKETSDWALLELPEALPSRNPLTLPLNAPVTQCLAVFALGYPFGRPLTFSGTQWPNTPDAWITDPGDDVPDDKTGMLFTTLDAFESMSGSPVFDSSGKLVGMLLTGISSTQNGTQLLKCGYSGSVCVEDPLKYARALPLAKIRASIAALITQ